ncbi:MAG: DUF4239 domain-containing protein [Cytophagales bacterium]|nr:DUF4239 domain-containing protein [Cytophaga sp.]
MNYFWIYDIPMICSFLIVVGLITAFSIGGIFVFKFYISRWWEGHDNNDQIAFYLSAIGVFYGITLGLLAAGIWQNFEDADDKVTTEASSIAALYRNVSSLPAPKGPILKEKLANYTHYVIYEAWPLHQRGIATTDGTKLLNDFQSVLYTFEPATLRETTLFEEAIQQYSKTIELRRQRLSSVESGMPMVVWLVIFIGAFVTLVICWMFNIPTLKLHIILNGLIGVTIGSLIYLILMFDYPFRGALSISSDAYLQVYKQIMK